MSTSIWCYLWDLVDGGIEHTLDEIQEDGLDGVSVATVYHSVEHLRIHGVRPFIYHERDASLYFAPQRSLYTKTKLKPKVSPIARKGNPLKKVGAECQRRGLVLNSWTVGTHNSYLCRQRPDCAERNVFGDPSATGLCPSNPDVRAYLLALLSDLTTNYPIRTVELESFLFEGFPHFHTHEKIGIPFGETDRFLLGLCFCDSCQRYGKKSGADVAAVKKSVRRTLEKVFAVGMTTKLPLNEFVARAKVLHPYLAGREETTLALMAELREACKARLVFMHYLNRWTGGYQLGDIARHFDAIMLLCYGTPKETKLSIKRTHGAQLHVGFQAYPPVTTDARTLAEQVRTARRLGVNDMNFYNYGIMPRRNLSWIKAALRNRSV